MTDHTPVPEPARVRFHHLCRVSDVFGEDALLALSHEGDIYERETNHFEHK